MGMTKAAKKAWDILNNDEQTALSLSLGYGKSTWEAGEVMGKVHFKYLEIQKRASKFLEIFTNHFEKYGDLIPDSLNLPFSFTEYLRLTIIERNNISTAVSKMETNKYMVTSYRGKCIIKEMLSLKGSTKTEAFDLYSLIMDFDRWNNFRILPQSIQEPSAYKRRNKSRDNKHIKTIINLPQYSLHKLIEIYSYNGGYDKLYLPIISRYLHGGKKILRVKNNRANIRKLSDIGMFLFEKPTDAEEFCELIYEYFVEIIKTCRVGQRFWPKFRESMEKAINYKELENIHRSRTYLDSLILTDEERGLKIKEKNVKKQPIN